MIIIPQNPTMPIYGKKVIAIRHLYITDILRYTVWPMVHLKYRKRCITTVFLAVKCVP